VQVFVCGTGWRELLLRSAATASDDDGMMILMVMMMMTKMFMQLHKYFQGNLRTDN